jgi:formylglycine-generating enzyme required for sulfatase activity
MIQKPNHRHIDENVDAVRLPHIFGIKPGKYLAALYALVVLAILFAVLLYPALSNPGIGLEARSEPQGAAIRIDDVYYGTAPCKIFLPEGKHRLSAVMPGFLPHEIELDAGSRLFGSLFFPKTMRFDARLTQVRSLSALFAGVEDYAAWTFSGEPTEVYQIPLSLSEGAYRSAPRSAADVKAASAILEAAARFMVSKAALKDMIRASFLIQSGGNVPSPLGALASVRGILEYVAKNPAITIALGDILPEDAANKLIDASIYPQVWGEGENAAAVAKPIPLSYTKFPLNVEGISFSAEFLPNTYVQNADFPHEETLGNFMISRDEITFTVWERFLAENPEWDIGNLETLIQKKQVTDDYLHALISYKAGQGFSDAFPGYPAPSVSGVSFFAAEACCAWLSEKLPPALAKEYELRLPREAEWEYAAKYAEAYFGTPNSAAAPRGMTAFGVSGAGNAGLWEWCSDYYVPLNYLSAPEWAQEEVSSPERSVRGGSWVNQTGTVNADTRASLAPESCSPFVGFRVVIALRTR